MSMSEAFEEWRSHNPLLKWRNGRERSLSRPALAFQMTARGYKVTPGTILRWEHGENNVPDRAMNLLVRITGIKDLPKRWTRWQNQKITS